MYIKELTVPEFNNFAKNSEYDNYHQTLSYALLKSENGYEYEIIGFCDDEKIYAAAIVLVKILDGYLYAYIPEGFFINYHDDQLLKMFTDALYKYYKKEDIVFIRINPPIKICEIDSKTHNKKYISDNYEIINKLKKCGYIKLEDSIYFESILPKYNAIIDLDNYSFDNLSKNVKNKIRRGIRRGLTFEIGNANNINQLYSFIKKKINRNEFYYNDYYNIFKREDNIDYFLISIDYEKFITNSQISYNNEQKKNELLNIKVVNNPNYKNINSKMNSDKTLNTYKEDIALASKYLNSSDKVYIAGALVIKHGNTATILINGYDKKYYPFSPNYYLFYEILHYYHNKFKFIDLNGITGDFSRSNKYHGLNQFKLGFKPNIYEYIGEFDLIINSRAYNHLVKKGYLKKEFENK